MAGEALKTNRNTGEGLGPNSERGGRTPEEQQALERGIGRVAMGAVVKPSGEPVKAETGEAEDDPGKAAQIAELKNQIKQTEHNRNNVQEMLATLERKDPNQKMDAKRREQLGSRIRNAKTSLEGQNKRLAELRGELAALTVGGGTPELTVIEGGGQGGTNERPDLTVIEGGAGLSEADGEPNLRVIEEGKSEEGVSGGVESVVDGGAESAEALVRHEAAEVDMMDPEQRTQREIEMAAAEIVAAKLGNPEVIELMKQAQEAEAEGSEDDMYQAAEFGIEQFEAEREAKLAEMEDGIDVDSERGAMMRQVVGEIKQTKNNLQQIQGRLAAFEKKQPTNPANIEEKERRIEQANAAIEEQNEKLEKLWGVLGELQRRQEQDAEESGAKYETAEARSEAENRIGEKMKKRGGLWKRVKGAALAAVLTVSMIIGLTGCGRSEAREMVNDGATELDNVAVTAITLDGLGGGLEAPLDAEAPDKGETVEDEWETLWNGVRQNREAYHDYEAKGSIESRYYYGPSLEKLFGDQEATTEAILDNVEKLPPALAALAEQMPDVMERLQMEFKLPEFEGKDSRERAVAFTNYLYNNENGGKIQQRALEEVRARMEAEDATARFWNGNGNKVWTSFAYDDLTTEDEMGLGWRRTTRNSDDHLATYKVPMYDIKGEATGYWEITFRLDCGGQIDLSRNDGMPDEPLVPPEGKPDKITVIININPGGDPEEEGEPDKEKEPDDAKKTEPTKGGGGKPGERPAETEKPADEEKVKVKNPDSLIEGISDELAGKVDKTEDVNTSAGADVAGVTSDKVITESESEAMIKGTETKNENDANAQAAANSSETKGDANRLNESLDANGNLIDGEMVAAASGEGAGVVAGAGELAGKVSAEGSGLGAVTNEDGSPAEAAVAEAPAAVTPDPVPEAVAAANNGDTNLSGADLGSALEGLV